MDFAILCRLCIAISKTFVCGFTYRRGPILEQVMTQPSGDLICCSVVRLFHTSPLILFRPLSSLPSQQNYPLDPMVSPQPLPIPCMSLTNSFKSWGIVPEDQVCESTGMSENCRSPKRLVGLCDLGFLEPRDSPLSEDAQLGGAWKMGWVGRGWRDGGICAQSPSSRYSKLFLTGSVVAGCRAVVFERSWRVGVAGIWGV